MIRICVCDDSMVFLNDFKKAVEGLLPHGKYSDHEFELKLFAEAEGLLNYCVSNYPDIVFLDIEMPKQNGLEIADALNKLCVYTLIIFVTSHDDLVFTSLRYHPFRFLRKTHLSGELLEALDSAIEERIIKDKTLTLGSKYLGKKLLVSQIMYIESDKNYVCIVTNNNTEYLYRATVSFLDKELSSYGFIRVHSAFIVNMAYIKALNNDSLLLFNNKPVLKNMFSKYLRR